jgi:hypothetical protein
LELAGDFLDDPQKQAIARRRFRPEFKVAFDAWMVLNPRRNPRAPPGPTYMPQYQLTDQAKAEALDRQAEAASAAGNHAGVGGRLRPITVFLAAVLFLVGIGSTFNLPNIRYALIAVGSLLLAWLPHGPCGSPGSPADRHLRRSEPDPPARRAAPIVAKQGRGTPQKKRSGLVLTD